MLNPSIDVLLQHVDSKYSLVVGAAKRARELGKVDETPLIKRVKSHKPVGVALEEIHAGKIMISPQQDE